MKAISGAGWLLSRRRGRLEHEHRVNNIPAHIRYHFKKHSVALILVVDLSGHNQATQQIRSGHPSLAKVLSKEYQSAAICKIVPPLASDKDLSLNLTRLDIISISQLFL